MKKRFRLTKFVTSIVLTVAIMLSSGSALAAYVPSNLEADYMEAIVDVIMRHYKFDADELTIYKEAMDYALSKNPELLEGMLDAATKPLDKYSTYFSPEELNNFNQYLDREYVGIGVTVGRVSEGVMISAVSSGSPADEAGFEVEDIIAAINGEEAYDFTVSECAERIRGEAGTTITITVKRGDEFIDITAMRAPVSVNSCAYDIIEEDIGYIYISQFTGTTPYEVSEALDVFKEKGTNKTIVDVRDNPGGELSSVIATLSLFVPKGKRLVTIDYEVDGYDLNIYSTAAFTKTDRKLVVLMNEKSASAAELFAGGIKCNDAGKTVGELTYGKGSVQEFLGLKNLPNHNIGDIKLSVAEYLLPNGEVVNHKGVEPDYWVKNTYEEIDMSTFSDLLYEKKYTIGDSGDGVYAIKERLAALGYYVGEVNSEFDEETAFAVELFQKNSELYPYGVADITTQIYLDAAVVNAEVLVDNQLKKAIELLKE